MAKKVYLNQIQRKINALERERNQVLKHLALVNDKLSTLTKSLEIMQEQARVDDYNTELFVYATRSRRFKGNLRKIIIQLMKADPNRYFTVNELTQLALKYDNQPDTLITDGHTVSVRGALKHWLDKGIVERYSRSVTDVKWKLNLR
ncbi:DNA repair protein [Vespertiliibacter pulmonis]|uniref:DNA repair ATPase n=1 Tax=Vespertiliibacter pulmonis TaxID=1443036 RepID=A0A3N4VKS4_9PAST|nr:DNA repair protein [Vespertiliibacter pulmonis]QLB21175.1 DNA repair protein [Vespertiliibacter pulmonis]RPE83716.1 hypothetical protein EDC46_0917 [Vespertiliibacter pulmonis]